MDLEVLWKSEFFSLFFSYFLYLICLKVGLDAGRDNLNGMKGSNKITSEESFLYSYCSKIVLIFEIFVFFLFFFTFLSSFCLYIGSLTWDAKLSLNLDYE